MGSFSETEDASIVTIAERNGTLMAIPINETAKIYTVTDFFIMNGRFISKDDEFIHLAVKQNEILKEGMNVKVLLTSEVYGLMPFRCTVTDVPKRFAIQQYIGLNLKIEEELPSLQRRRDIKVRLTNMKAEVELLDIATGKPSGKTCEGIVADISASGLLFVTREELVENEQFLVPLPAVDKQLKLRAKVIRTQREREGYTGYGCSFVDLRTGQEEMLRQYVFKAQVMQRKSLE